MTVKSFLHVNLETLLFIKVDHKGTNKTGIMKNKWQFYVPHGKCIFGIIIYMTTKETVTLTSLKYPNTFSMTVTGMGKKHAIGNNIKKKCEIVINIVQYKKRKNRWHLILILKFNNEAKIVRIGNCSATTLKSTSYVTTSGVPPSVSCCINFTEKENKK
ncbi:hypothetical protein K501DRAFT_266314 [Backusella circina FSU 941]|nr:hypothetical protein K501DRAFT_266314 [Backusella circina FSU 941]